MLNNQLFQSVLANPEDLELRLVFGDWMESQGSTLGELIRLQIELAKQAKDLKLELIPVVSRLEVHNVQLVSEQQREHAKAFFATLKRSNIMVAENRSEWNAPIHRYFSELGLKVSSRRAPIRGWNYERGFIEHVTATAEAIGNYSNEIFRIGPIRSLTAMQCTFDDDIVSRWINDANLNQVESFYLRNIRFQNAMVEERFWVKFLSRARERTSGIHNYWAPAEGQLDQQFAQPSWLQRILSVFNQ